MMNDTFSNGLISQVTQGHYINLVSLKPFGAGWERVSILKWENILSYLKILFNLKVVGRSI